MSDGQGTSGRNAKLTPLFSQSVAFKYQASSIGAYLRNITEGVNNGSLASVTGIGPVVVEQGGTVAAFGSANSRLPVNALCLPVTPGLTIGSSTVIPAPDFSPNLGAGMTSFQTFSTFVSGTDWFGSFAPSRDGTIWVLQNVSGGGQALNIPDRTLGGPAYIGFPYVALGFFSTWEFIARSSVVFGRSAPLNAHVNQGSFVNGSRVCVATASTDTMIYQSPSANAANGLHMAKCEVIAQDPSTHALIGYWGGVRYGFNNGVINIGSTGIGTTSGTPIVAVQDNPGTAQLKMAFSGGSLHNLLYNGPAAHILVNDWVCTQGQFL